MVIPMKLVLDGTLPSLNEYIRSERANRYAAAKLKADTEFWIVAQARLQLGGWRTEGPVELRFHWYERNRRRDKDNICFAKKFILDALQRSGTIPGDGWKVIGGFTDTFAVDKHHPRVEVEITER